MRTYLECYPCFINQALDAAKRQNADDQAQYEIIQSTLQILKNIPFGATPPEIAYEIHQIVKSKLQNDDPFKNAKVISTKRAMEMYSKMKSMVLESTNPLKTAIKISIAGNILDLAMQTEYVDLWETVNRVLHQDFAINDSEKLIEKINYSNSVLFIADNAGETVFDRILIETLDKPVIYVVKSAPILNDATLADAIDAGIDESATIIDHGSDAPGTILTLCSEEFAEIFSQAHVVIAKGQANYETLSISDSKVFCLLQVKCPVIGKDINAPVGSIIVRQSTDSVE